MAAILKSRESTEPQKSSRARGFTSLSPCPALRNGSSAVYLNARLNFRPSGAGFCTHRGLVALSKISDCLTERTTVSGALGPLGVFLWREFCAPHVRGHRGGAMVIPKPRHTQRVYRLFRMLTVPVDAENCGILSSHNAFSFTIVENRLLRGLSTAVGGDDS